MSQKKWTINTWNAKIDRTKTVMRIGKNGIWYEYLLPISGNPFEYYNDAMDVRSRKSPTSKWPNGKRPGQYQPIGDKRYFNFYQLNKMTQEEWEAFYNEVEVVVDELSK